MSEGQVDIIQRYYDATPQCEVPPWAHGLVHYVSGVENPACDHMQWDYGLGQDMESLCRQRRGPCPFVMERDVFDVLAERRARLCSQMRPIPLSAKRARKEI